MLEHKGIPYKRTDLVAVISKAVLRAARFEGVTVPALILDGERIQGSRAIARRLDEVVSEPPLFPADPGQRTRVEEAERWGDEVLQPMPRRMVWNFLKRDRTGVRSFLEGARLGLPTSVAAATAAPIIALSARFNEASDDNVRRDIAELAGALDEVDRLVAEGVIGGAEPNAADFQIAPSVALLMTMEDVREAVEGRPAAELARRICPDFPGRVPPAAPADWLEPLRAA